MPVPWFPVALSVAFAAATETALAKRLFGPMGAMHMAAIPMLYSLPISLIVLFSLAWPAQIPTEFWVTLAVLLPFNAAGFVCHMAAASLAPLSLTMPFLSFTPAFVILAGNLLLGETVNSAGTAGITLVVAGSYVINLDTLRPGDLLAPFKAIVRERGSRLMLMASVLYGICSVLGKRMVNLSDPIFTGVTFFVSFAVFVLLALRLSRRIRLRELFDRPVAGMVMGGVSLAHILLHMWAVSLVQTAYMISVKRLSGLFSVGFGALLFGERNIPLRLAGAMIMCLGAVVISLWG